MDTKLKVEDVMTTDICTVTLGQTVAEIIDIFVEKNISGAPVVDQSHRLITVVSEADLMKFAAMKGLDQTLSKFSNKLPPADKLIVANRADSFIDIFKQFLQNPVRRVIVVDGANKVLGIVSRRNILRTFRQQVAQGEI